MHRCLLLLILIAQPVLAVAQKPNIIFIFADDWGYGDLGIHGSTFCKTPNLDRMAKEGTDFQNFAVNHPVCSPSRTAAMTGHFPARYSVHGHFASLESHVKRNMPDWLDPQAPMLPRMLQQAGFATGHFGKWHLTNHDIADAPLPPAYGYDEYGAFNLPGVQIKTAETCPRAVDFIARHKDQPFYMNVWLHETHLPHYPLEKYLKQFEHLDERQQVYAAVVAEADAGVGSILSALKKHGIDDNTLVIFSSDNGPEWTSKGKRIRDGLGAYYSVGETAGLKGQKRSLYAGGVRVPFIARWPGVVPAGKVNRQSVLTAVDLLPTFVELAGAKLPAGYEPDGQSVVSALKGDDFLRTKPIYWEWASANNHPAKWPHQGVQEGKWKMLINEKLKRIELYDIQFDWAEQNNQADAHPEVVIKLTEKIRMWKHSLPTQPSQRCLSAMRK